MEKKKVKWSLIDRVDALGKCLYVAKILRDKLSSIRILSHRIIDSNSIIHAIEIRYNVFLA